MDRKKRKSTRVHTRKLDRGVARFAMKKQRIPHPNKKLSEHWREFV